MDLAKMINTPAPPAIIQKTGTNQCHHGQGTRRQQHYLEWLAYISVLPTFQLTKRGLKPDTEPSTKIETALVSTFPVGPPEPISFIIADAGSTGNFLGTNTPVINQPPAANPNSILCNPNGSTIHSTHEAKLDVPGLPAAARKVHIVPGLASHSLLSIGQLCDAGCDVTFTATDTTILYKDNHFDIISAIFDKNKQLPVRLIYHHVEGHQRERYPGRPLDSWALLNDNMDTLAKAYWLICHHQNTPATQQVGNNEWAIWIDNEKICKKFKPTIREKQQQRRLEQWWQTTKRLDKDQIRYIYFQEARQAWKYVRPSRRRVSAHVVCKPRRPAIT
jgi:hypothetical protein